MEIQIKTAGISVLPVTEIKLLATIFMFLTGKVFERNFLYKCFVVATDDIPRLSCLHLKQIPENVRRDNHENLLEMVQLDRLIGKV
ncbi:hypothetical protein B9Z55_013741 [Caenorhabditis nigoni]|uniref:Uncharacterized protein n=1 Tax=Caenorhabditis nigoni TaxID=1611254 RepID=A0A2G5U314_9PELO|nr:hypothetical protein B9Z55_013741 [Caenorhabditis nigoni]